MKVQNRTDYDTAELRKVFMQVLRDTLKQRPTWAKQWKEYGSGCDFVVTVGNRHKGEHISGRARLDALGWVRRNGEIAWNMYLTIPASVEVAELAAVFRHELFHSFGVMHGDMGAEVLWSKPEPFEHYPELLGLPKQLKRMVKPKPGKPTTEQIQSARVARLLLRRKSLVTKARRTLTMIEKIDEALKRYEKQGHREAALRPNIKPRKRRQKRRTKAA